MPSRLPCVNIKSQCWKPQKTHIHSVKKKNNVRNRKIWTKHVNEHAVQQIFAEGNLNRGEEKHSKVCSAIECSFSVKLKNVQSVEPFHCVKGTQVYRWLRRRWSGTQFVVPFEVLKNVRLYKRLLFECFQECLSIAGAFFRVANEVLCVFSSSAQPFVLHKKFPLQSHRTIAYEFIKKSVAPYSFEKKPENDYDFAHFSIYYIVTSSLPSAWQMEKKGCLICWIDSVCRMNNATNNELRH